jgi:hypothetical protein
MGKRQQVVVQEHRPVSTPIPTEENRASRLELFTKKMSLAAITMLGIGYVLVNAPVAILVGSSMLSIPISSQAGTAAIAGRILFVMALAISASIGVLFIYGAVQFYERGKVKGVIFLGVSLGAFYLLCLGVGSTLLLPEPSLAALTLTIAPLIVIAGTALYISSSPRYRLLGSSIDIVGGITLAYSILNLQALDLVFKWGIPFTGPFLSLTLLEGAVVVIAPVATAVHTAFSYSREDRLIPNVLVLLVALVYGLGTFIGSITLSMNFWNRIWQSPWSGPFHGLPEWFANMIVFWSASLVLMDIGGILLIAVACVGFVCVARQLSKL